MSELDDSLNLRGEWLQQRARLFDRETGLPTLATVVDEVRRHLEDSGSIALLTLSLNAERQVEETFGFQTYDRLISDFVKELSALSRNGDIPPTLLCLPGVRSDEIIAFVPFATAGNGDVPVDRWLPTLAGKLEAFVKRFVGERVSGFDPFRSHVGHSLILFDPKVRMERSVYRGLREARGEVIRRTASAEEMGAEVIKGILAGRKVVSVFQPIVDLVERRVTAVEALSRGPAGSGLEDAESLFSLAERVDLVVLLERLCRRRSLEEAARVGWKELIFINMSPAAAQDNEFLEGALARDVSDLALDPTRIVIEVTERTYAQHQDLFSRVLGELRSEGFRIAVDDLGSGYSNLSALADIKPEFLKFDHLFTKDIQRQRIKQDLLGAILSFAMKMETQVIAEGIESEEELTALRRLGVPLGQGYFLGRPASMDSLVSVS